MKIFGTVLAVVYACIMILAAYKADKKSITSVFIAGGGLLVLVYSILNLFVTRSAAPLFVIGILGMASVSAGALINGIRQKNVHISHHLIRLVIEGVILALCAVS